MKSFNYFMGFYVKNLYQFINISKDFPPGVAFPNAILDVFPKKIQGGFAPLTPTGAPPLDPAGGCAPRAPHLVRRSPALRAASLQCLKFAHLIFGGPH